MRLVVFTALPDIEATSWWPVITNAPDVTSILIVQKTVSRRPAAILRRLWKNVLKHGVLFVPYRAAVFAWSLVEHLFRHNIAGSSAPPAHIEVRRLRTLDMHHPYVLECVQDWEPELGVSVGAPVLKPELFSLPRLGTLNVHCGKVPEFRGAPPGFWELWYGAKEIGATVHWMDTGLDTGAIIEAASAPIYEHDSVARVEARAAELGRALLAEALRRVAAGDAHGSAQAAGGRTNRTPTLNVRLVLWCRLAWRRVRARLADPLALVKYVVAIVWLAVWRPLRDLLRTVTGRHPVRVFTYHRITDLCRDGMTVPEDTFVKQLSYLRRHHTVVDLDSAVGLLTPGRRLSRPVAVVTFDDGYQSVGTVAFPRMQEFKVPGTSFVCTGLVGTDLRLPHDAANPVRDHMKVMDWGQLRQLREAGWHIGGHTINHSRLSDLHGSELVNEVSEPLVALKERLSEPNVAMAYPFGGEGDISAEGILAVKQAGYAAHLSDFGGENFPGDDPLTLRRIELGGDHDSLMWKAAALGLDLSGWKKRLRREETPIVAPNGKRRWAGRAAVRVTHIVFDLDGGGMESLVATMAARWHCTDVQMSVITLSGRVGRVGERVRPLVEQYCVPRLTPGLSMIAPQTLVRALRLTRPDVAHIHTGAWFKGAYAARLAGVPRVVYTEHGREHNDPALARLQDRAASRLTDRVVAVSERLSSYLEQAVGVARSRLVTIHNGVDTQRFSPRAPDGALKASLQIPDDALVIGSVGRLERVKAYDRLVAAFAEIRKTDFGRPLVLVIFGEGADRDVIERAIDLHGVRNDVRVPGWTTHPADAYRMFDVFAMTSKSEGMSVSLMEAMACGVCPLVTDVGSNAEVLGGDLAAHVAPDGDAQRFVDAARELLRSASRREAAGALARAAAVKRHSLDRMIREYEVLYGNGTSMA